MRMRHLEDMICNDEFQKHDGYFDGRNTYIDPWPNLGFKTLKDANGNRIYVLALFRPQHKDHWSICKPLMHKIAECERDRRISKGYVSLYDGERGRYKDAEFIARQTICYVENVLKNIKPEEGTTFKNGKVALPYYFLDSDFRHVPAYSSSNEEEW